MKDIAGKIRRSRLPGRIFHTLDYCLGRELRDCESVLDLGCGPSSPLQYCKNTRYSVGVEIFRPYLEESKKRKIHTEYINKKIEELDFPKNSFDAVILIEVLEHLPKETGRDILEKAQVWARKKVVLSTPNGYFPMESVDGNARQRHLSGWSVDDLEKIGFAVYGMSGAKFLYSKENKVRSLANLPSACENIKIKPKMLFYLINAFLQIIAYRFPQKAFGLLGIRKINDE